MATNQYNSGTDATYGQQSKVFFYDKAGIKAATQKLIYQQFASQRNLPTHTGQEYRVSVFHHIYDRLPFTDSTWNDMTATKEFSEEFAKYGYLSSRDIADVDLTAWGSDGRSLNDTDNGKRLLEGEGASNQVSIQKSTFTAKIHKFGEMLDYTEEVDLFSEDLMQLRYYEELGQAANRLYEDLLQMDMLATTNVVYSGVGTSLDTMGTGIGVGTPDATTGRNTVEEAYKVNYELMQKVVTKLEMFRAPKKKAMLKGSTNIGTTPIQSAYVAIVGPQVRVDLENVIRGTVYERNFAWVPVHQYATQGNIIDGEIGSLHGVRFILSESAMVYRGQGAAVDADYVGSLSYSAVEETGTDGTTVTNNYFDVFPILIPAEDSFATIGLMGHSKIVFSSKKPTDIEKTDPYGSNGFFSYKFWYGSIILRPERLMKVLVLASA